MAEFPRTYTQLQTEIEELTKLLSQYEDRATALERVRNAIYVYQFRPKELAGALDGPTRRKLKTTKPPTRRAKAVKKVEHPLKGRKKPIKYRSGRKTWSGAGNTPNWLKALESEGRKREEFLTQKAA